MENSNEQPTGVQPEAPMQQNQNPVVSMPPTPETVPVPVKKSSSKMWLVVIIVVLVLGAGAAVFYFATQKATPTQQTPTKYKVGLLLPFSGDSNSAGFSALHAVQLAQKQLNATNIEFVQADSKCDPTAAPSAMQSLADQKVVAVIGESCSGASLKALPIANKYKIPMVSPSATSPDLSIPNDYFFRVVPPDGFQGTATALTMYSKGIRKVAFLYSDEAYGNGLTQVFKTEFTKLGGTIVADESVDQNAIDMNAQAKAIAASHPDAVYVVQVNNAPSVAALKQLHAAGVTATVYGSDALYSQDIVNDAQDAAEGLIVTSFPAGTKDFKQAFANANQTTDNYAAAQAYDAFWAISLALQKGATTGEAIKNQFATLSFQGVSGHIQFDKNGEISDPSYKYDLLEVKNGQFTAVE